jgi:hypothetical protein
MIGSLGDLVGVLETAEPAKKAALYESLGLALKYEPCKRRVLVEAGLGRVRPVGVGGRFEPQLHAYSFEENSPSLHECRNEHAGASRLPRPICAVAPGVAAA